MLLGPEVVLRAFERFDKRRDGVTADPQESRLSFGEDSSVAAHQVGDPIPRFCGKLALLQVAELWGPRFGLSLGESL